MKWLRETDLCFILNGPVCILNFVHNPYVIALHFLHVFYNFGNVVSSLRVRNVSICLFLRFFCKCEVPSHVLFSFCFTFICIYFKKAIWHPYEIRRCFLQCWNCLSCFGETALSVVWFVRQNQPDPILRLSSVSLHNSSVSNISNFARNKARERERERERETCRQRQKETGWHKKKKKSAKDVELTL